MTYYELFQQGPAAYVPVLLFSLVITIVAYGAVPFIIAKTRKTPITKKKYRGLCYGINIAVMLLFIVINGEASSGGPYLLWTWVFSSYGIKVLGTRGIMADSGYLKDDPTRMTECRSCGYRDKNYFDSCPKCGSQSKQYTYLDLSSPANDDKIENKINTTDLDIDKMTPTEAAEYLYAEQLGEQYTPPQKTKTNIRAKRKYCSQCGTLIDSETKKCTGCGKQYFRGFRFTKFSVTVIVLTLIVAVLSTVCVLQFLNLQTSKGLNQAELDKLKSKISNLEQQVKAKETTIKTRDTTIKNLEKKIDNLEDNLNSYKDLARFIDTYVVFIEDDGTDRYHKFACDKFKGNYFWVFNIENAKAQDYKACPYCH